MQWFESWFDSPYYPILYTHRSQEEANLWIDTLYQYLNIQPQQSILDLACGAGRHAIRLAQKGNEVVGIDLAPHAIASAKASALDLSLSNVTFLVGDMRDFRLEKDVDFILNLFTSFGYFEQKSDNQQVIHQIAAHQKKGGVVVIDYLNSAKVYADGEIRQDKTIQDISFHIHKYIEKDIVYKDIRFEDKNQSFYFQERVQLFRTGELEDYFHAVGYTTIAQFGSYQLEPYRADSDRAILIFRKD